MITELLFFPLQIHETCKCLQITHDLRVSFFYEFHKTRDQSLHGKYTTKFINLFYLKKWNNANPLGPLTNVKFAVT